MPNSGIDPSQVQWDDAPAESNAIDPASVQWDEPVSDRLETLHNASTEAPDVVAKNAGLARAAGVDYEIAKTVPDEVEKKINKPDWKGLATGAPKTAKYLSDDPVVFQQAHDDTQALADMEKFRGELKTRGIPELKNNYGTDANSVFAANNQTGDGTIENTANLPSSASGNIAAVGTQFSEAMTQWKLGREQQIADAADSLGIKIGDAGENAAYSKNKARELEASTTRSSAAQPDFSNTLMPATNRFMFGGVSSLAQTAPVVATALANPVAGLTLAYDQTSAMAYGKYRQRGATKTEAALGSSIEGAIEVVTEKNPLGFAAKSLGKMGAADFAKQFLGREMLGEQAATFFQDLTDTMVANPDKTMEQFWQERPEAFVQTMFAVGTNTAAMSAIQYAANKTTGFHAEKDVAATQHINDIKTELAILENSKLAQRSPETMHEYLDHIDGEEKQTVFVDPSQLFNQGGVARADLERIAPSAAAQIDEALDKGGLIEIPKNELLIGLMGKPDIQGNVVQFLKADANADSLHDINTQREGLSQEMYDLASKQIEKSKDATKLTTQRDEIIQHLQDSMSAAGMDDAGNKHRAAMIASGIVSQAIREKVDPVELYKQQVGNISNAELQGDVFNRDSVEDALIEERDSFRDSPHNEWTPIQQAIYDGVTTSIVDPANENTHSWLQTAIDNNRLDLAELIVVRAEKTANSASVTPGVSKDNPKYESIKTDLEQRKKDGLSAAARLRGAFEKSRRDAVARVSPGVFNQLNTTGENNSVDNQAAQGVVSNGEVNNYANTGINSRQSETVARFLQWADSAGLHGRTGIGAVSGSFTEAARYKGELRGKTNPFIQDDERIASPEEGRLEQEKLIATAKENGFFIGLGHPLFEALDNQKNIGGMEHDAYAVGDSPNKILIRNTINGSFGHSSKHSPVAYLKRLEDYNKTFPEMRIDMIGVSEDTDGNAVILTAQQFFSGKEFAAESELDAQLRKQGWFAEGISAPGLPKRYKHKETGAIIGDVHPGNILHDGDKLYPIDVIVEKLPSQSFFQNQAAPRGTFNPITREIGLTNAADLSTFLHESGHLFLEITADLAAREGASESVKKDMDTAFQWFGITGESFDDRMAAWNKMTLDEKRPYHEKWAESFEQYLFEGKAPSMELRDAFRNFRQWLTHVYKSLSQFVGTHDGAKLNDEMRSVFDRMLATEQQIEEMEAARGMLPLFSKKPAGMTESEWTSYRQAADEATQSAVEQLTSRSLRDMKWLANAKNKAIRKLQREAADERRVARMEARQQVLSQPVYRAWQFLKAPIEGSKAANKKAKQSEAVDSSRDSLLTAIAKLGGLDKAAVVSEWGLDTGDFSKKGGVFGKPVLRKDGGLTIDGMAEALSQHNYLPLDENGKWDLNDLYDRVVEESKGVKQYSTDADYDVLLGETQYAAAPDAEQVDFVGGRLSRQAIREMYDDADLANMQGEKVDTAGKLMQEEKYKPDLFVAHNLTAENLVHSDELGGLAAPSLGVSRTTTGGFTGFGEITLLADKSILTDRDARTFDADVYSPRHPRAVHKIDDSAVSDLESEVNASQGKLAGMEMRLDSDSLERRGLDELLNNDALKNSFLVSKGILIKPKMKAVPDAVKQAIKYLDKNAESKYAYESYNLRDEDWFIKLTEKHYAAEFEKWKSLSDKEFSAEDLAKYGPYEADGSLKPYLADQLARQVASYHKNGGQDSYANQTAIAKKFRDPKLEKEFVSYAEEKFKTISKEKRLVKYTKNGNAKYSAYNLDNIVAEMTRELQGGEGFNYGAGSVRSAFAFEFKHNTIESIKSFKGGIVSKEDMNKVRDEANDRLGDALDKLRKFYKYDSSSFGYSNDASSAIAEGPKGQAEAFRMNAESKAIIKDITGYLRELPSEYFETKMQRAVGIGEFKAAIVPKGTDQKVLDILARNGISKIDFYDPKKPGARTKAISKQDGLLFQPGRDKQQMLKDTDMATSDDYGVRFETGVPVTFNFLHNKESATKLYGKPKKDSQWNRGYEPAGRFMIQVSKAELPSYGKFDTGSITFKNPIVIENDSLEWKKKLSSLYGGKTGKRLSVAIIDDGFDGIVTVDKGHTSEIVDLTTFDYKKALYQIGEEKDANDKRTLESLGVMSDEGLHPDTVADLFGLSSGDELVRKLLTMPDPVSEIERLTDEIMLQRHSDLATPEGRERAAESAIHNEARAKFIATELAMLNRAIGKPRMIMAAAKEYAGQIVSALRVRDLKTGQYDAAEAKASKEADKALRDGNTAAAALAKRNQVLHNMTAKMVRDAQDEVEKAVRYLKKFDKPNKKIDIDYQEQIDTLLERYDLRQKTLKAIERSQNLAQWIEQQKAEGLEPVIPDYLQDEAKRTNYKMLTVEELRGLVDAVKNIEHLGRLKNRLLTDKAKRELNALADGIGKSIADNGGDVKPSKLERNTAVDRLSDLASGFFSMHRKLASIVRQLDGWKDGGILWDAMIRPMNEAGDHEAVMHEKSTMALAEVFAYLKGKKLTKKLYIPMIATSLSHEGRLAVALNWGNEGNRQRLMDGDKWGVGEVNAILSTLTAEDWKFVQGVWDHIATYKDEIGEQQRRLTGVEPSWVDATPFEIKTADGQTVQVQGGYYPAKYDTTRSTQALSNEAAGNVFDQWRAAKGQGKTRDGFTKSRATQVKDRPLRKDFGVITQHITEVTHRLAWQDWVVDMNRLIKKEQVDSSIRAHYGNEILEEIRKAIEDITTGDVTAQSSYEQAINHLRIGTTIVGLGWNLTTSLLQPFGLTQSMVRIGPKWIAKGLATWIGNPARMNERTDWVYSKSDFMRLRGKTMMREMNEILNTVRKEKLSKIEATYFYGIQKMQVIADMPTWLGQYEKSMAEFDGDEEKAIALADQAVLDAQGGGQNKDLARIQRGGPLLKLWTNFYSYFNTTYNLTREVAGRTDVKDPASVAKAAVDMLLLYTIPSVMVSLLKGAIIGDDDEDELADRLWRDQLGYLFGSMVGLREISAAFSGFNGYSGPAGTRFFSEIARLGKQAEQGEADAPFLKSLNNVGGILFHYPAGQINRTIEGGMALYNGETDSPAALIFGKPK